MELSQYAAAIAISIGLFTFVAVVMAATWYGLFALLGVSVPERRAEAGKTLRLLLKAGVLATVVGTVAFALLGPSFGLGNEVPNSHREPISLAQAIGAAVTFGLITLGTGYGTIRYLRDRRAE